LIKVQYIHTKAKPPWTISIHFKKMKGRREKSVFFRGENQWEMGGFKKSRAWWCTPLVPATLEAEAGGLLELRSLGLTWVT
jgi:hypothetical protein